MMTRLRGYRRLPQGLGPLNEREFRLLYLARRRIYSQRRARTVINTSEEEPHGAMGPTLHDSWSLPVMKSLASDELEVSEEVEPEPA